MKLEKFNLPAEVTHMISTLEPEHQGIVYCHLFAYIYDGIAVPDDIEPRCHLIITMILRMIDSDLRRARGSRSRSAYRPADSAANRKTKFWSKRDIYKYNRSTRFKIADNDTRIIIETSKQHPAARKQPAKLPVGIPNAQGCLSADKKFATGVSARTTVTTDVQPRFTDRHSTDATPRKSA